MRQAHLTLAQWRARLYLSQRELAEKAQLSQAAISHIENAKYLPHLSTRRKLAEALRISPAMIAWPTHRKGEGPRNKVVALGMNRGGSAN
jgi:DNA-binding XRE family transcriptional regulator